MTLQEKFAQHRVQDASCFYDARKAALFGGKNLMLVVLGRIMGTLILGVPALSFLVASGKLLMFQQTTLGCAGMSPWKVEFPNWFHTVRPHSEVPTRCHQPEATPNLRHVTPSSSPRPLPCVPQLVFRGADPSGRSPRLSTELKESLDFCPAGASIPGETDRRPGGCSQL